MDEIKATEKSPVIEALLTSLTGRNRVEMIEQHRCMACGGPAEQFSDALSLKEYTISGMCQKCQDSVFTSDDDTEEPINI